MGMLETGGKKASAKGLERRAEKGESEAQYDLGLLYSTGQSVPQDYVAAHKWFNLAAMNGNSKAQQERKDLAESMSPTEIAEAQRLAREWKLTH